MSELNTPYETLHAFTNEQGIECVSVVDCNGMHVFDCYEADASELLSRINRAEQQSLASIQADAVEKLSEHFYEKMLKARGEISKQGIDVFFHNFSEDLYRYAQQLRNSNDGE